MTTEIMKERKTYCVSYKDKLQRRWPALLITPGIHRKHLSAYLSYCQWTRINISFESELFYQVESIYIITKSSSDEVITIYAKKGKKGKGRTLV